MIDLVSLSAILLDDGYYQALQSAKRMVDGVPVLDETVLIPFKARAFLNLTDEAAKGEKVDQKNIRKHRNDVFRIYFSYCLKRRRSKCRRKFAMTFVNF